MKSSPRVGVYILAKNEAANICRTLAALSDTGWYIHVLDSGSSDGTQDIVSSYKNASVSSYNYLNHCVAYNEILTNFGREYDAVLILDADMIVSGELYREVTCLLEDNSWDALRAPIQMWVEGNPLRYGSLYPPKPFAFRPGEPFFLSTGHAEKLRDTARVFDVHNELIHDDRKSYGSFLQSQARYSDNLLNRYEAGQVSGRDKLRVLTPFLVLVVPLFSLLIKGGIFGGKFAFVYALDRMIAEAVMYRQSLVRRANFSKSE